MAKAKKQALSPEERLAQALVPEDEQPYEVPGNWVWTRLGSINVIIMGQSPKGDDTTDDSSYTGLIGGATDMGELYPLVRRYTVKPTKISHNNDVIISIRATIGKPIFSDGEYCLGRGVAALRSDMLSSSLTRYFLLAFEERLYEVATGTTFAQISKTDLDQMAFPLPPLPEQQRIVECIESLFAKLDRAKELAQNALDTFETRKAAILHKAFTGELTAKWREEYGVGMESWEEKPLKNIAKLRNGYAFNSKEFTNAGYQVVRMGNLYNGTLDLSRSPVFISTDSIGDTILSNYSAKRGDILLTLTGTKYKRDYGYAVLIEQENGFLVNQRIMSLTPTGIEQNLLLYYLRSDLFRDIFFSNETGGVNQGNVSSRFVGNILVSLPPLPEQQEIVRILDSLFEKEQRAKELCDVIEKIDMMKKTILARAFRGELGTNDPAEESALGLLKEVLA